MTAPQLHDFFVFDAGYLSPALVSVFSFLQQADSERWPVTMVYLAGDTDEDSKTNAILHRFVARVKSHHPGANLVPQMQKVLPAA